MAFSTDRLSALVGRFYEAAANPELWEAALTAFAEGADSRGTLLPAATFFPGRLPHSPGMGDTLDQFFSQGWHQRDLRTIAARARPVPLGFICDQHLFSEAEIRTSSYYRGFAQSAGVPWFCSAYLSLKDKDDYIAVSLQRTAKEGPFQPHELAALEALLPHLRNAAELAKRVSHLHGHALVDGLELGGEPALLVNAHGRVDAINQRAQRILGRGLSIRAGRLVAEVPSEHTALMALVASACATDLSQPERAPCGPIAIRAISGGPPLVVRAAPIRRSGSDIFGFTGALVMISNLADGTMVSTELLSDLFKLTRREAQIMSQIGQGARLSDIATALQISREAVRFHLKSVFAKTGTNRQSELVSMHERLRTLGTTSGLSRPRFDS